MIVVVVVVVVVDDDEVVDDEEDEQDEVVSTFCCWLPLLLARLAELFLLLLLLLLAVFVIVLDAGDGDAVSVMPRGSFSLSGSSFFRLPLTVTVTVGSGAFVAFVDEDVRAAAEMLFEFVVWLSATDAAADDAFEDRLGVFRDFRWRRVVTPVVMRSSSDWLSFVFGRFFVLRVRLLDFRSSCLYFTSFLLR